MTQMEQGMYSSDRCQFCRDFGEKVEPYLCPECKTRIWELGYRKLDPDQSLPKNPYPIVSGGLWVDVDKTQKTMLKENWVKVIPKENNPT